MHWRPLPYLQKKMYLFTRSAGCTLVIAYLPKEMIFLLCALIKLSSSWKRGFEPSLNLHCCKKDNLSQSHCRLPINYFCTLLRLYLYFSKIWCSEPSSQILIIKFHHNSSAFIMAQVIGVLTQYIACSFPAECWLTF